MLENFALGDLRACPDEADADVDGFWGGLIPDLRFELGEEVETAFDRELLIIFKHDAHEVVAACVDDAGVAREMGIGLERLAPVAHGLAEGSDLGGTEGLQVVTSGVPIALKPACPMFGGGAVGFAFETI
jgi:hypothetical protein